MHTAGKACQRRDSHLSHATAGARGPQPARVTARARARTPPLAPGPRSRHAPAGAAVCWWSGDSGLRTPRSTADSRPGARPPASRWLRPAARAATARTRARGTRLRAAWRCDSQPTPTMQPLRWGGRGIALGKTIKKEAPHASRADANKRAGSDAACRAADTTCGEATTWHARSDHARSRVLQALQALDHDPAVTGRAGGGFSAGPVAAAASDRAEGVPAGVRRVPSDRTHPSRPRTRPRTVDSPA